MNFKNILDSYLKCHLGKNKSYECTKFQYRLGYELIKLEKEMQTRSYAPAKGKCFWITYPKTREIWASAFRDRVVHHLIVGPLEKNQEPKFINQSYSCRKNKGPFAALKELQKQVRSISQGGNKIVYALQMDIKSFFISIDRDILRSKFLNATHSSPDNNKSSLTFLINRNFDFDIRENYDQFIGRPKSMSNLEYKKKSWLFKSKKQGIPIGNLTSQFGANLYLNQVDQYIKRILKPKGYLRYMDDLLLLDTDIEKLKPLEFLIEKYLQENLNQNLNFDKTDLKPLTKGITYLGYVCRQEFNMKEPLQIYPTKKKKYQFIEELRAIEKNVASSVKKDLPPAFNKKQTPHILAFPMKENPNELASLNSRLGILKKTNSSRFIKYALDKFKYKLTENAHLPKDFAQQYCPIKIRKDLGSVKVN